MKEPKLQLNLWDRSDFSLFFPDSCSLCFSNIDVTYQTLTFGISTTVYYIPICIKCLNRPNVKKR